MIGYVTIRIPSRLYPVSWPTDEDSLPSSLTSLTWFLHHQHQYEPMIDDDRKGISISLWWED